MTIAVVYECDENGSPSIVRDDIGSLSIAVTIIVVVSFVAAAVCR